MTRRREGRETFYRLLEWDKGQAASERLVAIILSNEGFEGVNPSHPLGGKDGGKDMICFFNRVRWIGAVYFPRGQQSFGSIKEKFIHDFCVYFHNKDMKFHCYEVLIITKCNVDYNRWFVEDFGIKFFNIISIDEINNSLTYRKPYYIQSKKFKKLINTIIKDSNYDIYKVGFKNKKKLIKNRYKNML